MIGRKKRILVPLLALVLSIAISGNALAYYSTHYQWNGWFYTIGQGTSRDEHVYAVQTILNYCQGGCSMDGIFGSQTTSKVKAFQTSQGITADGIVGPNTWSKLQAKLVFSHNDGDSDYYKISGGSFAWFSHSFDGKWWVYISNPRNGSPAGYYLIQ